jgi:hypothetical protein
MLLYEIIALSALVSWGLIKLYEKVDSVEQKVDEILAMLKEREECELQEAITAVERAEEQAELDAKIADVEERTREALKRARGN